jgi:hypothetical protein
VRIVDAYERGEEVKTERQFGGKMRSGPSSTVVRPPERSCNLIATESRYTLKWLVFGEQHMRRFVSFILGASIITTGLLLGTQAQATIIDGTWRASASGRVPSFLGPDPMSVSATFSFGNAIGNRIGGLTDFSSNFGADGAIFVYENGDRLGLDFQTPALTILINFINASSDPTVTSIYEETSVPGIGTVLIPYSTISGSFTPASVPEPGTLALFGSCLAGLTCLLLRRSRKPITA